VQVDDAEQRVVLGLQAHPVLHRRRVVADVDSPRLDALKCVVDLHAITQDYDAKNLSSLTIDMA